MSIMAKELSFGYNVPILSGLNFSCDYGEVTAVLGANGVGKTTLLNTLAGLHNAISGTVRCAEQAAYVPQVFYAGFDYSVMDIVLMGRASSIGLFSVPSESDEKICIDVLKKLNIYNLSQNSYNKLSGGQRQLVLIARALATESKILILDEPTSALDLSRQAEVLRLIKKLAADGFNIIFTTHEPSHALITADRTLLLLGQNQWIFGSNKDILTGENLSKAYGVEVTYMKTVINNYELEVIVPVLKL